MTARGHGQGRGLRGGFQREALAWAAVGTGAAAVWFPLALFVSPALGPWPLVAWSAASGVAWSFPRARLGLAAASAVGGLALLLALVTPAVDLVAEALVENDPPAAVDAVVALGGGPDCSTGRPNGVVARRLEAAAALFRAGYAPVLAVSDPDPPAGAAACPLGVGASLAWARARFPDRGATVVSFVGGADTEGEAASLARLAGERAWRRVMVVTSATHTRRACADFRARGLTVVCVASAGWRAEMPTGRPLDRFLALGTVGHEYAGLLERLLFGGPGRRG